MRNLVLTILLLTNINASGQAISLEKMLTFIDSDANKITSYLQLAGWNFNENQFKNNDSSQIISFWEYGNTGDFLYHQLYFSMHHRSHTARRQDIWEISYKFYNKEEYIHFLNSLLNGRFKKTAGINYEKNIISQDFYYSKKVPQMKDSVILNIHLFDRHHQEIRGLESGFDEYELEISF